MKRVLYLATSLATFIICDVKASDYYYDEKGRLISDDRYTYFYDDKGNKIAQRDDVDGEFNYIWEYDDKGNVTHEVTFPGTITFDSGIPVIPNHHDEEFLYQNTYNDQGKLVSKRAGDYEWIYTYNEQGKLASETKNFDSERILEMIYDDKGRLVMRNDYDGEEVTIWEYDDVENKKYQKDYYDFRYTWAPDSPDYFTVSEYDDHGNTLSINGEKKYEYEYDEYGNILSKTELRREEYCPEEKFDPEIDGCSDEDWEYRTVPYTTTYHWADPAWKQKSEQKQAKPKRRIYTIDEANQVAGKTNHVKIRYR